MCVNTHAHAPHRTHTKNAVTKAGGLSPSIIGTFSFSPLHTTQIHHFWFQTQFAQAFSFLLSLLAARFFAFFVFDSLHFTILQDVIFFSPPI
jgi:hypothetical protein